MPADVTQTTLSRRRWMGLMGAAAVTAGCGKRGGIAVVPPPPVAGAKLSRVVVATSRSAAPAPEFFGYGRSFTTNFAQFDVSIPPDRESGTIRYPRNGRANPKRDFVVVDGEMLDDGAGFIRSVNEAAALQSPRAKDGTLFVHGFNTNFAEALMKDVQLRHDLDAPGVGVMFTWPSEAKLLAYIADRENALFSRDALEETLRLMSRTSLTGFNLVAHSMGTFLAMETMRTVALSNDRAAMKKINAVILISADLEIDVFRKQAPPVLAAGIPIFLLVSDDDKALKLSGFIRGEGNRVGNVRSRADLGGLDVGILDLSAVDDSKGDANHLKIGSSPELIAFIQRIRASGVSIFDDGQKVGLLDAGAAIVKGTTGLILSPF